MKCRRLIVILLIVGIVAGVVGSSAWAAPKNGGVSKGNETLLDPFTLKTLTVTSVKVSDVLLTRRAIRIPLRPACRSAFRPEW